MSKSKRIEGPFTNKFGQTFNPGDQAIAVTTCTGRTNISRVEYVGYIERSRYNWHTKKTDKEKFVQIRRPTSKFTSFWKGTDEKASRPYGDREVEYRDVSSTIISTLQYNNIIAATASVDEVIKAV
jgi:hypothetical protein